ncbi:histidinol-phosphate transaminase [Haloplasma contractile]|uniref:Histidinol-phosphate aminotransferase n=1 Tax=Haloplasma contractile SSD-17B TaxID=1033810 RepID=U2FGD2_9MOLU|nr:histidinol-phosphate transaminase [Haloplasma contractile]ERJ11935.1 Histidinol-phosphate aminotransferase protein [Haloplasma contractile SSD-17B]
MERLIKKREPISLTKKSIQNLIAYKPNTLPYRIKLDANESNQFLFNEDLKINTSRINMYPDNYATDLRNAISHYIGESADHIIAGNGSSEMIELLFKTYVDKNDVVFSFDPSFSMYGVYSQIYNAELVRIKANTDFSVNIDDLIEQLERYTPKLIFICTPNNPTGTVVNKVDIKKLLDKTDAIVVVDEAYMEFFDESESMVSEIKQYSNLVVLRTLSKAFGLAAIRVGYMVASAELIEIAYRVKSPYNINTLSQLVAIEALNQTEKVKQHVNDIIVRRNHLYRQMKELGITVYPSHGNFLFFKYECDQLYKGLINKGIIIRKFSGELNNHYRVTVGNAYETKLFIQCVEEILNDETI